MEWYAYGSSVAAWIDEARNRLRAGRFTETDLDALAALSPGVPTSLRQRLLYLHCKDMAPTAEVIAWAFHPADDPGGEAVPRPYATVLAALDDGWRVIHFPQQLAPFDDAETDLAGFEFVLEKLEPAR